MKQLIFSAFVLLLAMSCNKDEISSTITPENLIGCWNHDSESQITDGSTTYLMTKCEAKDFPGSWFRYSLIFAEDNKGSEFLLAENDAHDYHEMTWRLSDQNLTVDGLTQKVEYTVEIISDESILLTKR